MRYGVVRGGTGWYEVVRCSTEWYGFVWSGMWRYEVVRSGVIDPALDIRSILLVNGGTYQ